MLTSAFTFMLKTKAQFTRCLVKNRPLVLVSSAQPRWLLTYRKLGLVVSLFYSNQYQSQSDSRNWNVVWLQNLPAAILRPDDAIPATLPALRAESKAQALTPIAIASKKAPNTSSAVPTLLHFAALLRYFKVSSDSGRDDTTDLNWSMAVSFNASTFEIKLISAFRSSFICGLINTTL